MTNWEWTPENEIKLFCAMMEHKPVGLNKHFQMMMIHDKLTTSLNCEISSSTIWKKLETLYNLRALDESNKFPNIEEPVDFSLPEDVFADLVNAKINKKTNDADDKSDIKLRQKQSSKKDDIKEDGNRKEKGDEEEVKETPRRLLKRGRDSLNTTNSPTSNKRRRQC